MAKCPQCNNNLGDEFGLTNCSQCGLAVFLDMDGQVVEEPESSYNNLQNVVGPPDLISDKSDFEDNYLNDEEDQILPENSVISQNETENEFQNQFYQDEPIQADAEDLESIQAFDDFDHGLSDLESAEDPSGNENDFVQGLDDSEDNINDENVREPIVNEVNFESNEDLNLNSEGTLYANTEDVMNEVVAFANSEKMESREGVFRYKLCIENIDTKDLAKEVYEALEDSRFLWDPEEIMSQIKMGVLIIGDLNPIKASLLVFRLRDIDVALSWEQYEIHSN
jgi:hypothetical protein